MYFQTHLSLCYSVKTSIISILVYIQKLFQIKTFVIWFTNESSDSIFTFHDEVQNIKS